MFNKDNASQKLTIQGLYCVWIRADETPGAPLIAVWMDAKMRAFEAEESGDASGITDCRAGEEAEAFDS
jgi:hypothetical protein